MNLSKIIFLINEKRTICPDEYFLLKGIQNKKDHSCKVVFKELQVLEQLLNTMRLRTLIVASCMNKNQFIFLHRRDNA